MEALGVQGLVASQADGAGLAFSRASPAFHCRLPRRSSGTSTRRLLPHSRKALAVKASSKDHHDPIISGVDELADGSVVLHFSEEAAPEKQDKVVSYLTRPVEGHKNRSVAKDTIVELVGEKGMPGPVQGVASLVKGVFTGSSGNGASNAATATNGAASTAPAEDPSPQTTTALTTNAPGAPAQPSGGPPKEDDYPPDLIRAVAISIVSAVLAVLARVIAMYLKFDHGVKFNAPISLAAMAATFAAFFFFFWINGFADESAEGRLQGSAA